MTGREFHLLRVKTVRNLEGSRHFPWTTVQENAALCSYLKVILVQNWVAGIKQFDYGVSPRYFFGYGLTVAAK